MDPSQIKKRIGRFRILVIGRANAGKTTILQRVCNTRDNPEIYNCAGKKIDPALLKASRHRGLHDIENEMVFQSNPGFVFHDSRGFEAGGESEFDKVKAFIASRSKEPKLRDQLHAIWYCIPMDEESRSFTQGEIKFFSQCDTGSIPVMVLFTKFDALYDVAFAQLRKKETWKDAKELAPKHAEESFANGPQLKFLKDVRWPPKCHVCLPNMDKDDADCEPLIKRTAEIMDNAVLLQLFVSTQQTNLELCMKYALERTLSVVFDYTNTTLSEVQEKIIGRLGVWFPHIWIDWDLLDDREVLLRLRRRDDELYEDDEVDDEQDDLDVRRRERELLLESHLTEMRPSLLSVTSGSSPLENIPHLSSAVVIIFEHSYFIFDKRRYIQDRQDSRPSFYAALERYTASPDAAAVRENVSAAVQAYEEAVTTAAHAYEEAVRTAVYTHHRNPPAWMTKLPFGPLKRKAKEAFERSQEAKQSFERSQEKEKESLCLQAKAKSIEAILKISLNHRMPRP